ncbi:uncharacterized protein I206_101803 [Kwoniella pini CBS 10737]|uniref:INO80 complex subunit B-like conserved region domain-containing protein n=1 Tax=Kwoniella pini CBS 10737 TaxID=1296096 RepID=A0A1B9HVN9_9TREE|nr:uncharacterized protein I206_06224 [Kwoniella pini CBS 10737]OCF47329.1 hypothetical protein I206_06224 [Kwoniella pini CBS 10737]
MAPKSSAIPASTRRAKRIIQSPSSSSGGSTPVVTPANVPASDRSLRTRNNKAPIPLDDSEVEENTSDEEAEEEDAEGEIEEEEEDAEGEVEEGGDVEMGATHTDVERSRLSSAIASEDIPLDDEEEDEDAEGEEDDESAPPSKISNTPASVPKIKLKFGASTSSTPGGSEKRPGRPAGKKGAKKVKRVAEDEFAESDDELLLRDDESIMSSRRSLSPTKMTARQRAKGNKDLQETLLQLPNEVSGKKVILTEAERIQKREETARRRKRQTEQKLQDEQDETINRLLRAQTSKSRSKLDQPSPGMDGELHSGQVSPSRKVPSNPSNMIRWSSTINKDGEIQLRVGAPKEKDHWISLRPEAYTEPSQSVIKPEQAEVQPRDSRVKCDAPGCEKDRKYRSTKKFEVGGCSLPHLKAVEATLQSATQV